MYGGQYIPDLTERFPEGFDGIDLTDKYFPCERGYDPYYDHDYNRELEDCKIQREIAREVWN